MKFKLMMIICCLSFSLVASAQASGGQIRRITPKRSSNASSKNSSPKVKTYTVKEQYEMGSSYYDKGNYQEAIKWYTRAAENGYLDAQSELGFMYLNGEGTVVNKIEAVKWLKMAGEKGDALAQQTLGYLYKNGDGVPRDEKEAQKWFKEAAPKYYNYAKELMKSGNPQCVNFFSTVVEMNVFPYYIWSQFHLGTIYYYGNSGQTTDYSRAYKYFKDAAEKGNRQALYYVGLCYEYGRGVPKNMSKAKEYYSESCYTSVPSSDF